MDIEEKVMGSVFQLDRVFLDRLTSECMFVVCNAATVDITASFFLFFPKQI